ncbi:hypothetical protein AB1Y20_023034 [Prymnesium parvum]|uniref:Pectin acetylesterase n=1 Tax=Prymnesium parvum TaxID=97485 RepID=A0AB34JFX3_PRYPA
MMSPKLVGALLLFPLAWALEDGSEAFYKKARISHASNTTYNLVTLADAVQELGARCLDGTPAIYYFRKGTGDGINKWYIHHQGGGWCESWDDCLSRSRGALGSSKGDAPQITMDGGYFSPSPNENPMMYNWNSVYVRYCDGGSFSGSNATVASYGGASLYFRGSHNRQAVYNSLVATYQLGNATDVVVSGCSAGGLATYLHVDQWCDALSVDAPHLNKCVGLPDSGFFLDYESPAVPALVEESTSFTRLTRKLNTPSGGYHKGLQWAFETFNASSGVNRDCVAAKGIGDDPPYLCMFAEHTAVFIHTPVFAMQSEYDAWQTSYVLNPKDGPHAPQQLGDNITKRMGANMFGPHPSSGSFLDSCHHHCGSWNSIRIDGDLISTAFAKWYSSLDVKGSKRVWRQGKPYPCDDCCKP